MDPRKNSEENKPTTSFPIQIQTQIKSLVFETFLNKNTNG